MVSLMTVIGLSGLNSIFLKNSTPQTPADATSTDTNQSNSNLIAMQKISLTTKDNMKIAADLYPVVGSVGWIILSHAMPKTKESWDDLAKSLQAQGFESIAIDLRGHGESDGGPDGYQKFTNKETQESILDLEAAADYLVQERLASRSRISVAGASVGANLSLEYAINHPETTKIVLLSAGLNYQGLETKPLAEKLQKGQSILFVSSKDDDGNAAENQELSDSVPSSTPKQIKIYDTAGHGTDMLKEKDLKDIIIGFLK